LFIGSFEAIGTAGRLVVEAGKAPAHPPDEDQKGGDSIGGSAASEVFEKIPQKVQFSFSFVFRRRF
jgi:hypothetical protein